MAFTQLSYKHTKIVHQHIKALQDSQCAAMLNRRQEPHPIPIVLVYKIFAKKKGRIGHFDFCTSP